MTALRIECPTIDDLRLSDLVGACVRSKAEPTGPVYYVAIVSTARDVVTLLHASGESGALRMSQAQLRRCYDYADRSAFVIEDASQAMAYASAMEARAVEKARGAQ